METAGDALGILSVGARLNAARQAAGMSINDVSQRIKLTAKQIVALENDDFEQLGLVFSRGFVRNYARLLGLDADELIGAIPKIASLKNEPLNIHDVHIPLGKGLPQYWLIVVSIVIALIVGIPLLAYHWLSADDIGVKTILAGKPEVHNLVTLMPAARPSALSTEVIKNQLPATPLVTAPPVISPPAQVIEAAQITKPTALPDALLTGNASKSQLHFQFNQDSWVEIHDASQHPIPSHLYHAGQAADITVSPPLTLTIGNAAYVKLNYNDQPVDITPHPPNTVTKLTLP